MRILALAALAALTLGVMDVRPADASRASEAKETRSSYVAKKRAAERRALQRKRAARTTEKRRSAKRSYTAPRKAASSTAKRRHATKRTTAKRTGTLASGGGSHGIASYYWQPQRVASGGYFNPNALTAAHRTLPFGTKVRVTNQRNGKSVVVTINDRGPFIKGRIIDLSKRAAGVIGMQGAGLAPVSVAVVGRSS